MGRREVRTEEREPTTVRYVRPKASAWGNAPLQPTPVASRLEIVGGPHIAGNSMKALERYARSLRHEPRAEVLEVAEYPPKS
uniref:Uncharacterized protein n=1 Tax=Cannabis sativa TaxID=3483 RepID=A0A803PYH4_CANSA